jgi:hypothetical protein
MYRKKHDDEQVMVKEKAMLKDKELAERMEKFRLKKKPRRRKNKSKAAKVKTSKLW